MAINHTLQLLVKNRWYCFAGTGGVILTPIVPGMFVLCLQSVILALENVDSKISESIHPRIFTQRSKTFTTSPSQELWVLQVRPSTSPSIDVMRCESFWQQNAISVQTAVWQLFITCMDCNVNIPKLKTQQANYKTCLEREKLVAFWCWWL